MKFYADLHIHSHFSLATSKKLTPQFLDLWSAIKGINVIATGDFTHQGWINELKEYLEPAPEQGLFKLKDKYKLKDLYPKNLLNNTVRFILSSEISTIYKKNDKVRKVHSVILAPDFESVEKVRLSLKSLNANLDSDGRPIIGLDTKDLLNISLEASDKNFFIPAHIWTPWFSALGSKSGFNSIKECFEELTPHIKAVETGLSTDPALNALCTFLDDYTLISNSDAHSPEKIGRNANIFNCDMNYNTIIEALSNKAEKKFEGTIDLFPQEGKYHYDGHRKCGVCLNPLESMRNNNLCPKCKKPLVLGVCYRISELAKRDNYKDRPYLKNFTSIIPLKEILSEIKGVGPNSKTIHKDYMNLISNIGSETDILLRTSIKEIEKNYNPILAEAIKRMRNREVLIKEGFDGEYGVIKLFEKKEKIMNFSKNSLFKVDDKNNKPKAKEKLMLNFSVQEFNQLKKEEKKEIETEKEQEKIKLNKKQSEIVKNFKNHSLIKAGPGSGKTRVIIEKVVYLLQNNFFKEEEILLLTFSNKAAREMRERITPYNYNINIKTIHAFAYDSLKEIIPCKKILIIKQKEIKDIIDTLFDISSKEKKELFKTFNSINYQSEEKVNEKVKKVRDYQWENGLLDFDSILNFFIKKMEDKNEWSNNIKNRYKQILVDEYQDLNLGQIKILKTLINDNCKISLIGDPMQSIYSFRGSDLNEVNNFLNKLKNLETYSLNQSYRCSKEILNAAQSSLKIKKNILKGKKTNIKLQVNRYENTALEAQDIAKKISSLIGGQNFFALDSNADYSKKDDDIRDLGDIAILCRLKSLMEPIEQALKKHGIPYNKSMPTINEDIDVMKFCLLMAIKEGYQIPVFLKNKYKINESDIIFIKKLSNRNILDMFNSLIGSKHIEFKNKENLEILKHIVKENNNFDKISQIINRSDDMAIKSSKGVSLLTIHGAKGLEFSTVFIPGCENNIIPCKLYGKYDIEEEKRLFYVALTRAKKYINLSYSSSVSPFILNIKKELYNSSIYEVKRKVTFKTLFD